MWDIASARADSAYLGAFGRCFDRQDGESGVRAGNDEDPNGNGQWLNSEIDLLDIARLKMLRRTGNSFRHEASPAIIANSAGMADRRYEQFDLIARPAPVIAVSEADDCEAIDWDEWGTVASDLDGFSVVDVDSMSEFVHEDGRDDWMHADVDDGSEVDVDDGREDDEGGDDELWDSRTRLTYAQVVKLDMFEDEGGHG